MKLPSFIKFVGLIFVFLFIHANVFAAQTQATSPVGYWKTVDDESGKVLSVVQIYKTAKGTYNGRVYKTMDVVVDGKRQNPKDRCTECTGDLANKPFLCMVVIYNMQASPGNPGEYVHGRAYDPRSDNIYHAKMWVADNGKKLHLRGYVGIPLFGRTETWLRTSRPTTNRNWMCQRSIAQSYMKKDWQ